MNTQRFSRYFFITMCWLSIKNNLIGQSTEYKLTKLTHRYELAPDQACKQAACQNAEQCLFLVLEKLNFDHGNVKKSLINNILENDKQDLSEIKSDHTQSWFWSFITPIDQKMLDTYNTATTLQKNRDKIATFIHEHVSCIQGYERIKFYSDMPTDHRLIPSWITTNRFAQEKFPLQSYKDKVASDLQFTRDLSQQDLRNYPGLAHQLEETKKQLTRSIPAIEDAYKNEHVSFEESEQRRLDIEEKQANIKNKERLVKIEQDKAQAATNLVYEQRNLVKAQEEENNAIRQLQPILQTLSWQNLNLPSVEQLIRLREQIDALKAKISQSSQEKRELHNNINNELAKLQRCIDDKKSQEEIAQLRNKVSNLPTDIQTGQQTYNSIQHTVAQAVERQKSIIAPLNKKVQELEQALNERPVLAEAVPVQNSPMAYAYVVPNASEQQTNSNPYQNASAPPMPKGGF